MDPLRIAARLCHDLEPLRFAAPVTHVYNPLVYAAEPYRAYVERYGRGPREVVLLGMNPGPWGMAQTGVPFGDAAMVRDWLGIEARVGRPAVEHPKRPVLGFACRRSEISGARLWGWARETFGTPERFFTRFFVANYCPLVFMEESGRNRTPDKLPAGERERLFELCDRALRDTVAHFGARHVIGIGAFAESRSRQALGGIDVCIGRLPHPSPASPAANNGWARQATEALRRCGLPLPSLRRSGMD